jgi:hypothetical protein
MNTCGCWKTKIQAAAVSDCYDDTELPFVDTRAAAVLCVGGPCSYVAKPCIMNDLFYSMLHLLSHKAVTLMFGCTMIWVTFSQHSAIMPAYLRTELLVHTNCCQIDSQREPDKAA